MRRRQKNEKDLLQALVEHLRHIVDLEKSCRGELRKDRSGFTNGLRLKNRETRIRNPTARQRLKERGFVVGSPCGRLRDYVRFKDEGLVSLLVRVVCRKEVCRAISP